jgi:YggT family protein
MQPSNLIYIIYRIALYLIIARVVISWIPSLRYNPIGKVVIQLVDPVLRPLQRLLPPSKTGGIDLSPLLALILLQIIYGLLAK